MRILGIETSCDETAASLVEDGRKILSNAFSSSEALHQKYGGIVPEVAARRQLEVIIPVIHEALEEANRSWHIADSRSAKTIRHKPYAVLDALAVTVGPGLIGSLLVGVETAKALALAWDLPLVPVNHLVGHIYAAWLDSPRTPQFPLVALVVSGGHTDLVFMEGHGKIKWLGGTRDDAAGEAFDKVARILGGPYPGGPWIGKISKMKNKKFPPEADQPLAEKMGKGESVRFPRPLMEEDNFDFSFSGLKTAVLSEVSKIPLSALRTQHLALAFEFQEAAVEVLVEKTLRAAAKYRVRDIIVAGGVSANSRLRQMLNAKCQMLNYNLFIPPLELCTDNAPYIAAAAYYNFKPRPLEKIKADPSLEVGDPP